jgi:hypothetical protein
VQAESSSPTALKCDDCRRGVEPATGGVDSTGWVLCERCLAARRSYEDGREDQAVEALVAVLEATKLSVRHDRIWSEVARALRPANGAAESIRRALGLDRDKEDD